VGQVIDKSPNGGSHLAYYIPFSKKAVDEIIAKSDTINQEKYTIQFQRSQR